MVKLLESLRGGLIVSCQPVPGGPMDRPGIVAALAWAALNGRAVGLRIEGLENLRAVRLVTSAPIIGLIKRDLADSAVRITPFVHDVLDLAAVGADVIAFDATNRQRPSTVADLLSAIRSTSRLAMADCSDAVDGQVAHALGADILGTTLSGYTGPQVPQGPDLALVAALASLGGFVVAEGRYTVPALAAQAMSAGANAVVAGSAITRTEHVTSWFVEALNATRVGGGPDGLRSAET